jgi:hypothetical protein
MTDEKRKAFNAGYLLACCNVQNMHGMDCIAADVLAEAGITVADLQAMDLSEYDAKALKVIREARNEDPILHPTTKKGPKR